VTRSDTKGQVAFFTYGGITARTPMAEREEEERLERDNQANFHQPCENGGDEFAQEEVRMEHLMNRRATSVRNHCLSPERARVSIDAPIVAASYDRMFPELPSFAADEQFLHALGRAGGLCDCGDIDDSPDSLGETAAGWPIFGQLVAHDITADRSNLRSHADPAALHNARSPQFNLECLYGDGPTGHPFLYQRDDPAKFLLGANDTDVQRNAEGVAVIGDPRNDSHVLLAQLHLAMLKAHNAFVDEARGTGVANDRVFDEAARPLRWHYLCLAKISSAWKMVRFVLCLGLKREPGLR
jgi:hypothetical protein